MHQKPDPLRWRSCLLAICLGGLTSITWGAEDPVFSGPQAGEKLTTFKVRGLFDDLAGKELDLIQKADGKPVLFIFVHQLTRPSNSLTQVLMRYVEQHPQELYGSLIFLGDDQTALEARLKRARHALPKKAPVTISLDGKEGPGAYGLNRNVTLTILFAKDGKVVSNFALISPSLQADMPKVLKPIVEVVGGKMPTLADLGIKRSMTRKPATRPKGTAPAAQIDLRPLLGPVIRKDASDEEVKRAALAAEKHFAKHPEVAAKTGRVARQIIAAGKLENYGTKTAQQFLKKWAEQFPEPKGKPVRKPTRPERRPPAPKPSDS